MSPSKITHHLLLSQWTDKQWHHSVTRTCWFGQGHGPLATEHTEQANPCRLWLGRTGSICSVPKSGRGGHKPHSNEYSNLHSDVLSTMRGSILLCCTWTSGFMGFLFLAFCFVFLLVGFFPKSVIKFGSRVPSRPIYWRCGPSQFSL